MANNIILSLGQEAIAKEHLPKYPEIYYKNHRTAQSIKAHGM